MGDDASDQDLKQALITMEKVVHELAAQVPQPLFVKHMGSAGFRYKENSIHQAIVQKLARMVSTLHAARLLLGHGFVQEVGALQRIVDELQQDVFFLRIGVDNPTDLHRKYLDAFYEEEFDTEDPLRSTQKRPSIPRKKIHAYNAKFIASVAGSKLEPSIVSETIRTLHKSYSGYVHAASPHIMELYGGLPYRLQFHMRGMRWTPRYETQKRDLTNYFYRGLGTVVYSSTAFDSTSACFDELRRYAAWFYSTFMSRG